MKILIEYGGIYLDMDVLAIQPLDEVRKYECTVGLEDYYKVCSGVIVCAKNHPFLYVWLDTYYDDWEDYKHIWAFHSGNVATVLTKRYPHLIHIEPEKFHWPSYHQGDLQYICGAKTFPWRDHYVLHTWIRMCIFCPLPSEDSIRTMNSTYGQIARQVYFGSDRIL